MITTQGLERRASWCSGAAERRSEDRDGRDLGDGAMGTLEGARQPQRVWIFILGAAFRKPWNILNRKLYPVVICHFKRTTRAAL